MPDSGTGREEAMMSSQPNNNIIAEADHALPGLALLLNEAALAARLGVQKVTRTYLRYKPGVSCVASLRCMTAKGDRFWMVAKAYPKDRFAMIQDRTEWFSKRYKAALWNDVFIALLPPQLDRKLKPLRRLIDPDRQQKMLAELLPDCLVDNTRLEPMRYKVGRRLVARLTDKAGQPKALLKVHNVHAYEQAVQGAKMAKSLGGPELLAANSKLGIIVTKWVDGAPLCPAMQSQSPDMFGPAMFRKVGEALARYHAEPLKLGDHLDRRDETAGIRAAAEGLADIMPDQSSRLFAMSDRAIHMLLSYPSRYGPTHGDFSADQVIVDTKHLQIIDWDRSAMGDQSGDLGSFLARLDWQYLSNVIPKQTAAELSNAFLSGYEDDRALPAGFHAQRIRHLMLLLQEHFRLQTSDWVEATHKFIDYTEALLDQYDPVQVTTDPALPYLNDALNPVVADVMIGKQAGLKLSGVPQLCRHKPGRRAMIHYPCQTSDGTKQDLLGKIQAKKPKVSTPALHKAFREAGLDGTVSGDMVGVPKAMPGCDRLNLWLMEHLPGTCLSDFQSADQAPLPFFKAGKALAQFHHCGVRPNRKWTYEQEFAVLQSALAKAGERIPEQQHALKNLTQDAQDMLVASPTQPLVCIHRDFYPDQVLVDDEQVWFLDLDLCAMGDPAIDLGNFLAHLAEYALRTTGDAAALTAQENEFLRGYRELSPDISFSRILIMRNISLLRHIHICLLFKDRQHIVHDLIDRGMGGMFDHRHIIW